MDNIVRKSGNGRRILDVKEPRFYTRIMLELKRLITGVLPSTFKVCQIRALVELMLTQNFAQLYASLSTSPRKVRLPYLSV
jgi:hypothetical protein